MNVRRFLVAIWLFFAALAGVAAWLNPRYSTWFVGVGLLMLVGAGYVARMKAGDER